MSTVGLFVSAVQSLYFEEVGQRIDKEYCLFGWRYNGDLNFTLVGTEPSAEIATCDGKTSVLAKSWIILSFGVPPISHSLTSMNIFSVESLSEKKRSTLVKNPPSLSVLNVWERGSLLRAFNGKEGGDFLTTTLSE